jgi:hypothetical protein
MVYKVYHQPHEHGITLLIFFGTSMISPIFPMAMLLLQWSPGRSQVIDDAQ